MINFCILAISSLFIENEHYIKIALAMRLREHHGGIAPAVMKYDKKNFLIPYQNMIYSNHAETR